MAEMTAFGSFSGLATIVGGWCGARGGHDWRVVRRVKGSRDGGRKAGILDVVRVVVKQGSESEGVSVTVSA